jgi:hypothetical protein
MFYNDDRIDEMDEDGQDMLLNDDADDLMMQQELEDEVAIV